jgi:hypothetical protein
LDGSNMSLGQIHNVNIVTLSISRHMKSAG